MAGISIFRRTGRKYNLLVALATLNQDRRWRRMALNMIRGGDHRSILELASGTGLVTKELLRIFPRANILAVDSSPSMIERHKNDIRSDRVQVMVMDALEVKPSNGSFDLIVAGYLPKYVPLDRFVLMIDSVLRKDGQVVLFDFSIPPWPARLIWEFWIRLVSIFLYVDPDTRDMAIHLWDYIRKNRRWDTRLGEYFIKRRGPHYRARSMRVSLESCTILWLYPNK